MNLTEHQLQKWLTSHWLLEGIPLADGTATLIAWEVMLPDWRINDARLGFGQPAIDFLAIDHAGGLVAIELKLRVGGPRNALRAACQVSHLAQETDRSKTSERLRSAHEACFGGAHGRTDARRTGLPEHDLSRHTRAVLAAPSWSPGATRMLSEFAVGSPQSNAEHLDQLGLLRLTHENRVCRRYADLRAPSQPLIETMITELPPQG